MSRGIYSGVTNACLIVGVVSAYGFDKNAHLMWLVLGGTAAVVAMGTYVSRHWRRAPNVAGTDVQRWAEMVAAWEAEPMAYGGTWRHLQPMYRVMEKQYEGILSEDILDPRAILHLRAVTKSQELEPARLTARIVGEVLKAEGGRREVIIAPGVGGSVTIRFATGDEGEQRTNISSGAVTRAMETVH
ncbi:MAG: hypothetical protein OXQ29_24040 [Rhodospirillaceae bacterium]|nr:hypothetical protein [Rhodospirillaceae bacterium]